MTVDEIILGALQGGPMTTVQIIGALNAHGKYLSGRILRKPLLAMVADGRMKEAKVRLGQGGRTSASVWYLPEHTAGQVDASLKTANKAQGGAFRYNNSLHFLAAAEARSKRAVTIP